MKPIRTAVPFAAFIAASLALQSPGVHAQAPAAPGQAPAAPTPIASSPTAAQPAVEDLLAHYMQARGGAAAWAAVQSMGWTGRVETEAPGQVPAPFLMFFRRPGATRFEVVQQTQRSVRVFDGTRGWRIHPGGERGVQVDDYSPEELAAARDACGLDGPLVDPAGKGVKVQVEGSDAVEGRKAWRLRVTLPSGAVQRHWIDAQDYRDLRYERTAHDRTGRTGVLTVWLRGYEDMQGLRMPMQIETRLPDGRLADRLVIEKVAINPELSADTFAPPDSRPLKMAPHGGVIVNATGGAGDVPQKH